jgi:hypothetical protein
VVICRLSRLGARKSPQILLLWLLVQWLATPLSAPAQRADTTAVFKAARQAEKTYLASIRYHAPFDPRSESPRECDEILGRFCIYYNPHGADLPAEPREVARARNRAITALAAAATLAPGRSAVAFPLVRFLVAAGRPADAVQVTRAYARASAGPDAHMLAGYAYHATGRTVEAAAAFESWLAALPAKERSRITDVGWLLKREEMGRYQSMTAGEKARYESILWRFADPLFLTPGNEVWTEHMARHALIRIVAEAPETPNSESWDWDVEQILIRYGPAYRTTRSFARGSIGAQTSYSEHWDPALRTYVPAELAPALRLRARPDTAWMLDSLMTRSGHAPPTIRKMFTLQHQAVVYPDSVERMVALASATLDKKAQPAAVVAVTWFLDADLQIVGRLAGTVAADGDSVSIRFDGPLPSSATHYSVELFDTVSHIAARAQYGLNRPARSGPIAISGLLVSVPYRPEVAVPRPVIQRGQHFGIYAEVRSDTTARTLHVEIETINLDKPSAVRRMAGWVGRSLGLKKPASPARLGWNVETEPDGTTPIAVTLDPGQMEPGRYLLRMMVSDGSGATVAAEREVLVIKGGLFRP